ncbi:hypothetical protein OIU84_017937 [Salix udensis]|uniref:Exportin-5 C-terminal domain-containing protein n=1 Tax=Salix udensis TaxID=889485 RepID=A0AAD6L303_9ROSI|nr:hypothetical protein OIU84_017937 [Salix udensis]
MSLASSLRADLKAEKQSGHAIRVDLSSLKELGAFASNSMVGFLLKHNGLAVPALQICLEAFTWTDGEAVSKVLSFCGLALESNAVSVLI